MTNIMRTSSKRVPASGRRNQTKPAPTSPGVPVRPGLSNPIVSTVQPLLTFDEGTLADANARRNIDRMIHAAMGRLTQGLSPETILASYADWWVHLAMAPGKQKELAEKALRKAARLALYSASAATGAAQPCIEPLPQDQRFTGPEWQRWPFNTIYESFLLGQQWWHNATTGVSGVNRHHEQVATFATRQLIDMGFKVTVTGGITKNTLGFFQPLDVSVVICGRGIREASDPLQAAREFRHEMQRLWGN